MIYNIIKLDILYNFFFVAHHQTLKERKKLFKLIVLTIVNDNATIKFNTFDKIVIKQLIIIN